MAPYCTDAGADLTQTTLHRPDCPHREHDGTARRPVRRRVSRDRNGARWTVYGLPGGYTTAAPVGVPLLGWQSAHAVPLLTFRSGAPGTDRYAAVPRLDYARGWALGAYELVP